MAELITNDYQEFTLEQLKTQDGITALNSILRTLVQNMAGDGEAVRIFKGYGTPEASVTAGIGSLYMRIDGTTDTAVYRKETGTGNTGWIAISSTSGGIAGTGTDNHLMRWNGTTAAQDSTTVQEDTGETIHTATKSAAGAANTFYGIKSTADFTGSGTQDIVVGVYGKATNTGSKNITSAVGGYFEQAENAGVSENIALAAHGTIVADNVGLGLYLNGNADFLAYGLAATSARLAWTATNKATLYDHLDISGNAGFGTGGSFNPTITLGGGSGSGLFSINGNYHSSGETVSLRLLDHYIFEVSKNLTTYTAAIGSSHITTSVTAPPNGLIVEGHVIQEAGSFVLDTQFDKTTNTTLATVTGSTSGAVTLLANVTAGKWYTFQAKLFVDADAVGGGKYAIGGTATATSIIYNINAINNATNLFVINSRQTSLGGSAGQAGATALYVEINGTIKVNAAGTLTVQFAQNASNGTSSVLVGSSFIVRQMF